MKKSAILLLALLPLTLVKAQVTTKEVNSKVTAVTVYMNGALITHTADVTLANGDYTLVFTGVSPGINEKSIQVSANSNVKITSITSMTDYLESKTESAVVQTLKDTLKVLDKKISSLDNQLNVLKSEEELILKNNDIKGSTTGMLTSELLKAADFYRLRLNEINSLSEKIEEQQDALNLRYSKINKQLTELNSKQNLPVYKISVTASVKGGGACNFAVKYLVSNAGWAAFYDIRATDVNSPVQLDYKAKVYNNCGIDWSNVALTLSTADPTKTAQRPNLTTWELNYQYDVYNTNKEGYLNESENNKIYSWEWAAGDTAKTDKGVRSWNNQFTTIEVSELTVDFDITTPYSIPSDNKVYFVDIQTQELTASFKYIAVPKMDKDAFLVASVTGWESLNLIEGNANIFYAGTYIGQSYINTRFAGDSLEISLGRDKKVSVTRVKKKDFSSKSFIGGNTKETLSYEITVRNNNKSAINIEIHDQIPVSQADDIKVNAIETSGATPEILTGKLIYDIKLSPSESKVITVTFSVQYPKSKAGQIKLQKTRSMEKNARFL